jgi:hypothetical protein
MSFKYSAIAAALVVSSAALAQAPTPTGVQPGQPSSTEAGETSDRTPDKTTQTPQNQQDTAGGKSISPVPQAPAARNLRKVLHPVRRVATAWRHRNPPGARRPHRPRHLRQLRLVPPNNG